ncbi:MAG TPA: glycerophosphodiester phosphodiesterase [Candidatus Saccharimonadales bacterium]|nr:glycerophosphodiester phosphodiesterase [Candidatus Saccharimonadales bacterium]
MLIISHRGAAGLARENTIEALKAGLRAKADILELDVRLTRDGVPVLMHDFHTFRTHRDLSFISRLTLAELKEKFKHQPIITLDKVLKKFFGKVILNIEIKGRRCGMVVVEYVRDHYIRSPKDWDMVLFSSFHVTELASIRNVSKDANLSLLHSINPFSFIAHHRKLHLTAVGFHRLYVNELAIEIAKRAGLFTYVYTVDRPRTALHFSRKGIDGIVTNRPDMILREIKKAERI